MSGSRGSPCIFRVSFSLSVSFEIFFSLKSVYGELYAKCTHRRSESAGKLSILLSEFQLNYNAVIIFFKISLYPFPRRCVLTPIQRYMSKLTGTFLQLYFLRARNNEYNSSNDRRIQSRPSYNSS
jgi:hypothetical protein